MVTNGTSNASLCLMPVNKKKTNSEITENVNYIKIIIFLLRQLFISTILIYIYIASLRSRRTILLWWWVEKHHAMRCDTSY